MKIVAHMTVPLPSQHQATQEDPYDGDFVRDVFERMAATYGITNLISSFGFCRRWRRQCVAGAEIDSGMVVFDLMSGMGECWHMIGRRLGGSGRIVAVDFSDEMCRRAEGNARHAGVAVEVLREDVLKNSIPDAAADCVVSSFGLKTFSEVQMRDLAQQIARILRPGGSYSLLEISMPDARLLRGPYGFYLRRIIPQIGRLLLGDPSCYRMLSVYTRAFRNCGVMAELLAQAGLTVNLRRHFFGCATSVVGRRRAE